jgi:hypothetical protein
MPWRVVLSSEYSVDLFMYIRETRVIRRAAVAVGGALLLSACAFTDEVLMPSAQGKPAAAKQSAAAVSAQPPAKTAQQPSRSSSAPTLFGTTNFEAPGVTSAKPSGTHVGQKIEELRGELGRLQARMNEHNAQLQAQRASAKQSANSYHQLIGDINARLQLGTTPGNPELVAEWNQAQVELNKVGESISILNSLSNEVASTSALAAFLLESTRATFELRGAVDEDHRQLAILEDEVNKTVVVIDRLLNELSEDVTRTQNYYTQERSNLTAMQIAIDSGEYIGGSLASRAYGVPPPPPTGGAAAQVGQRQPLVVIRFTNPNVEYEQALFSVVSRALERKPNAAFDLVAVAPSKGTPAQVSLATSKSRRYAESVLRSLTAMGLPADRITLSATSSPTAQVNEVHVYVR